jgi:hypothetical protein
MSNLSGYYIFFFVNEKKIVEKISDESTTLSSPANKTQKSYLAVGDR